MKALLSCLICALILAGCQPGAVRVTELPFPTQAQPTVTIAPSPSPIPSLSPTTTSTLSPSPSLSPSPASLYDCSQVTHHAPDSTTAQEIVTSFVNYFKTQWPTEYIGFDTLYSADQLGEYSVILGTVSQEQKDIYTLRGTEEEGYQLAFHLNLTQPVRSRLLIPELLAEQLPDAPAALFYCLDLTPYLGVLPPQELDLSDTGDCSQVEVLTARSPEGQAIVGSLEGLLASAQPPAELGAIYGLDRLGNFTIVQASLTVAGLSQPETLIVLDKTSAGYAIAYSTSGPTYTRHAFLRQVYGAVPDLPPLLLNCLDLESFFARLTPQPTSAGLPVTTPTPAAGLPATPAPDDFVAVARWAAYAVVNRQPDLLVQLIGDHGVRFARYAVGVDFLGENNSAWFTSQLETALQGAQPECLAYDPFFGFAPNKLALFFSGLDFDWDYLDLSQGSQIVAFQFFQLEKGYELVFVTPIPEAQWLNLRDASSPCP